MGLAYQELNSNPFLAWKLVFGDAHILEHGKKVKSSCKVGDYGFFEIKVLRKLGIVGSLSSSAILMDFDS